MKDFNAYAILAVLATAAFAGCATPPSDAGLGPTSIAPSSGDGLQGLGSQDSSSASPSTTTSSVPPGPCPIQESGAKGFLVTITREENRRELVGACLLISPGGNEPAGKPTDSALILDKGKIFLAANQAGPHYIRVYVDHPTDPLCQFGVDERRDYPGTGVVEFTVEAFQMCA